jgi:hypothetical protein
MVEVLNKMNGHLKAECCCVLQDKSLLCSNRLKIMKRKNIRVEQSSRTRMTPKTSNTKISRKKQVLPNNTECMSCFVHLTISIWCKTFWCVTSVGKAVVSWTYFWSHPIVCWQYVELVCCSACRSVESLCVEHHSDDMDRYHFFRTFHKNDNYNPFLLSNIRTKNLNCLNVLDSTECTQETCVF